MKRIIIALSVFALLTSCVSKKKYAELEAKNKETEGVLADTKAKLDECLKDKAATAATAAALKDQTANYKSQADELIKMSQEFTILTAKGADNVEKSLETIKEKDLKIRRMQDALNKKDSVTLAVVSNLKASIGIDDPDVEINVEKGVVFISISDKMLYKSASSEVNNDAKKVLAKVAKVLKDKPDFECMVEGHTDSNKLRNGGQIIDNWDLSVKRATSVVRVLVKSGIKPEQLVAAGRSYYSPLAPNDSNANKAKNRRTRIILMPKIDQFYNMIEGELNKPAQTAAATPAPVQSK